MWIKYGHNASSLCSRHLTTLYVKSNHSIAEFLLGILDTGYYKKCNRYKRLKVKLLFWHEMTTIKKCLLGQVSQSVFDLSKKQWGSFTQSLWGQEWGRGSWRSGQQGAPSPPARGLRSTVTPPVGSVVKTWLPAFGAFYCSGNDRNHT